MDINIIGMISIFIIFTIIALAQIIPLYIKYRRKQKVESENGNKRIIKNIRKNG